MTAFIAFCKKEFLESVRSYKLLILLASFAFFGFLNPLLAKLLPELLSGLDMGNGMIFTVPEPSAMDSWGQFFKNISQMGVIVLAIVFSGIMAAEFSKGTLINVLTKGMKRRTVIFSKLAVAALLWTTSYLITLLITYAYNLYFWGAETLPHALLAFLCPWAYGLLLISLMIIGGVCFKSIYGSLLTVFGAILLMSLINISPKLHKYNPITLSGDTLNLISGYKIPADYIPALSISIALTAVLIVASIVLFNRKQI